MTHRRGTPAAGPAGRGLAAGLAIAAVATLVLACGDAAPPASGFATVVAGTAAPPSEPEDTFPVFSFVPESEPPEPTDTDPGSPGTPPCLLAELKASRGITEVDADDRVTEVLLKAAGTCSVDAFPTLLLRDADGKTLVTGTAGGTGGIDLVGGVAYTSQVRLSNWCLGEPALPVRIGIRQGDDTLFVTGDSFPDEGDPPPCAHDDAPPVLTGTAWAPMP